MLDFQIRDGLFKTSPQTDDLCGLRPRRLLHLINKTIRVGIDVLGMVDG
jgi:hypothetical protein